MINALYSIIIFPLAQVIELSFLFIYRVFKDMGIAILGVSAVFSICTLPLYFVAEHHQQAERDLQKRFKAKIDKIKAAFKGDERYMIINTYYKQNHYHPVYAMRSSFGLLIQIPFFIAAFSYLSHLTALQDVSFLFIKDLGKPDMLLPLFGGINLLPFLMTAINCTSGTLYTKHLEIKDKMQVYGMALLFLVLLYNSPAGLVLYWTGNNIFSLAKNILTKTKHAKKIIYGFLCVFAVSLSIYVLFFHHGAFVKRLIICLFCSLVYIFPLVLNISRKLISYIEKKMAATDAMSVSHNSFILSLFTLFILAGLVIPSQLISSSTVEFSFIEPYKTPFPFIGNTVIQSIGIFLFWPVCIYFLFPQRVKTMLTFFAVLLCVIAITNIFVFPAKYGFLTISLEFIDSHASMYNRQIMAINAVTLIVLLAAFGLFFLKKKNIFCLLQYFTAIALTGFGLFNLFIIAQESRILQDKHIQDGTSVTSITPVYNLSNSGKNVIVIFLDKAISGYLPYIFEEKPELYSQFSGFVYYPNCVSFGPNTTPGAPPLFGGYEYTPEEINKKNNVLWAQKVNDAWFTQFKLFSDAGYTLTATDYSFDDYIRNPYFRERLKDISGLHYEYLAGKYTARWLSQRPDLQVIPVSHLLKNILIRFSFFQMAPPAFRILLYDNGYYLTTENIEYRIGGHKQYGNVMLSGITINNYVMFDYMQTLTEITSDKINTYTFICNNLTASPAYLQAPDYTPAGVVTNMGNGMFSHEAHYHVNTAALRFLGEWFDFLMKNNAYDNSRIIIVADHGTDLSSPFHNNIVLPDGKPVQTYNPLLLFKDFNAHGRPVTDNVFMTNADTIFLAAGGIIPNLINPFTGSVMEQQKKDGVTIVTKSSWMPKYILDVDKNNWLHVQDNIFEVSNWKAVEKP